MALIPAFSFEPSAQLPPSDTLLRMGLLECKKESKHLHLKGLFSRHPYPPVETNDLAI